MTPPLIRSRIIASIKSWHRLSDLARLAVEERGYGNNDGGFGVTYSSDLDDHDRTIDGMYVPPRHVEIYGFWGNSEPDGGYSSVVPVAVYLAVLADYLRMKNMDEHAAIILNVLERDQQQ